VTVSGVPCPSLTGTWVSVAAEPGIGAGVLRLDISTTAIVPVLDLSLTFTMGYRKKGQSTVTWTGSFVPESATATT
jgi:hypothetical protein